MADKKQDIEFDACGVGVPNGRFFGMPFPNDECPVVLIPVPWDTTVSYSAGTAEGPAAIIDASVQVDLYDELLEGSDSVKIGTDETLIDLDRNDGETEKDSDDKVLASEYIKAINEECRPKACKIIECQAMGEELSRDLEKELEEINQASEAVNYLVEQICSGYIAQGKVPGVVGGEHSVTFGAVKAAAASLKEGEELGVLQFDAHADLRMAYEGFEHSHASIMFNILSKIPGISALCQVGIRDFSSEEHKTIREEGRITAFTDTQIAQRLAQGENWLTICGEIVCHLPQNVYISFDIDGLEPSLCPNTGTPVPGGLTYNQAVILLRKVAESRRIVGFDLCEVAPARAKGKGAVGGEENEWDANVGARLLHKLSLLTALKSK